MERVWPGQDRDREGESENQRGTKREKERQMLGLQPSKSELIWRKTLAISTCKSSSGASNVLLNIRTITILQIGVPVLATMKKAYSILSCPLIQLKTLDRTSNTNIKGL